MDGDAVRAYDLRRGRPAPAAARRRGRRRRPASPRASPSADASPSAPPARCRVERDKGVKLHSSVTGYARCAVQMIGPESATIDPVAARMPAATATTQPATTSTNALSQESGAVAEVGGDEERRQQQEAPLRGAERAATGRRHRGAGPPHLGLRPANSSGTSTNRERAAMLSTGGSRSHGAVGTSFLPRNSGRASAPRRERSSGRPKRAAARSRNGSRLNDQLRSAPSPHRA